MRASARTALRRMSPSVAVVLAVIPPAHANTADNHYRADCEYYQSARSLDPERLSPPLQGLLPARLRTSMA
jgi:hypothetical protein